VHRRRMPILPIVVIVDVDPDWRIFGAAGAPQKGEMRWEGLRRGVPNLLRLVEGLRDSRGGSVRFTWMLRSDAQIEMAYGDPAHVADEFADFWDAREALGDEIGWHPHTWRYSESGQFWFQENRDVDWVTSLLKDGHSALSRRFTIRVAKTGWTYHDNTTMKTFAELGVKIDFSALPGMRYRGVIPGTDHPLGQYDWSRAPQEPYHPRVDDYQMPGNGHALPILEVPNWTFPTGILRRLSHSLRGGRSWREFADPAKNPRLVGQGFRNPPYSVPFVCYFHPEETIGPPWIFNAAHVAQNLRLLLRSCERRGIQSHFVAGSELATNFR